MIDAFYDRVEHLDLFTSLFPGKVSEEHRDFVAAWWAEVYGGPTRYTDDLGGSPNMLRHHEDLQITAEQRVAFVSTMSLSADDAELPADPEFRSALMAYLALGPRLAFENSQADASRFENAPPASLGWGVAPPYQP